MRTIAKEITEKQLVAEYEAVFYYVLSLTQDETMAEDIVQEAFLNALKSKNRFKGESSLYTWLCGIAKHIWLNQCKKCRRETLWDVEKKVEETKSIEQMLLDKESVKQIHKVLHHLKEPYKEVFSLRVFGELPLKEISELFEKSESWARVTYYRAVKLMIEQLEEGSKDEEKGNVTM